MPEQQIPFSVKTGRCQVHEQGKMPLCEVQTGRQFPLLFEVTAVNLDHQELPDAE